jgi:hypothetical protein
MERVESEVHSKTALFWVLAGRMFLGVAHAAMVGAEGHRAKGEKACERKRWFHEAIDALRIRVDRICAQEDTGQRLLRRFEGMQQRTMEGNGWRTP